MLLLRGLDASYEPMVVCTADGQVVEESRSAGIRTEVMALCPWRKLRNGVSRYRDAERLVALARQFGPDCIHASDMWLGNYLHWLRWRLRVPSVVHVRGPVTWRGIWKHRLFAATGLISISERVTRTLRAACLGADRIVQIEDAVDVEHFRPLTARDPEAIEPAGSRPPLNIGLVGRIEPAKRQLEFVRIASEAKRQWPGRVRFVLVGEVRNESYGARVKHLAEAEGLNGDLVLTGRRDDMPSVLNSLDILVSLSGGSVMYEAMSCGLCMVSAGFTRRGQSIHLRDGETGVVTPTADPITVARILGDLIQRPDRRRTLGVAPRDHAERRLSHVAMARRTMAFYDRLLGGRLR